MYANAREGKETNFVSNALRAVTKSVHRSEKLDFPVLHEYSVGILKKFNGLSKALTSTKLYHYITFLCFQSMLGTMFGIL